MPATSSVLRESHVAFENARTHASACAIGFLGVLGKLHGRAAMADGEGGALEWPRGARFQLVLQGPRIELIHEIERTRPKLNGFISTRLRCRHLKSGKNRAYR